VQGDLDLCATSEVPGPQVDALGRLVDLLDDEEVVCQPNVLEDPVASS
jgi:hypothetical protein